MEGKFRRCPKCFNEVRSSAEFCSCFVNQAPHQQEDESRQRNRFYQTDSLFPQKDLRIPKNVPQDFYGEPDYSKMTQIPANMTFDHRSINRVQEAQYLPFAFKSQRKNELGLLNPTSHKDFRHSQGSSQMLNDLLNKNKIPQKSIFSQPTINTNNILRTKSAFHVLQRKRYNIDRVSEEQGYKSNSMHHSDYVMSDQSFMSDTIRSRNLREFNQPKKKYQPENEKHSILQILEKRTPYQGHLQQLSIQPNVSIAKYTGQFFEQRCAAGEKFHFNPSEIEVRHKKIKNRDQMGEIEYNGERLSSNYANKVTSAHQFSKDSAPIPSTHVFQENRMFSENPPQVCRKSVAFPDANAVSFPPIIPTTNMKTHLHQANENSLYLYKSKYLKNNDDGFWRKSYYPEDINGPFFTTSVLNRETMKKSSHDQQGQNSDFFSSHATRDKCSVSTELLNHKNGSYYLKSASADSNTSPLSNQQCSKKNWLECSAPTNAEKTSYSSYTKNANKFQGFDCLPPSFLEISNLSRNHKVGNNQSLKTRNSESFVRYKKEKFHSDGHNAITHLRSNEKRFQCNLCLKDFKRKDYLKKHLLIHSDDRAFQCQICNKRFRRNYCLKQHILSHENQRLYKCEICNKRFNQRATLVLHIRTHRNYRTHQCVICKKSFGRKYNLVKHMRTHTDERPYMCDICKKSFRQKPHLVYHMQTHRDDTTSM